MKYLFCLFMLTQFGTALAQPETLSQPHGGGGGGGGGGGPGNGGGIVEERRKEIAQLITSKKFKAAIVDQVSAFFAIVDVAQHADDQERALLEKMAAVEGNGKMALVNDIELSPYQPSDACFADGLVAGRKVSLPRDESTGSRRLDPVCFNLGSLSALSRDLNDLPRYLMTLAIHAHTHHFGYEDPNPDHAIGYVFTSKFLPYYLSIFQVGDRPRDPVFVITDVRPPGAQGPAQSFYVVLGDRVLDSFELRQGVRVATTTLEGAVRTARHYQNLLGGKVVSRSGAVLSDVTCEVEGNRVLFDGMVVSLDGAEPSSVVDRLHRLSGCRVGGVSSESLVGASVESTLPNSHKNALLAPWVDLVTHLPEGVQASIQQNVRKLEVIEGSFEVRFRDGLIKIFGPSGPGLKKGEIARRWGDYARAISLSSGPWRGIQGSVYSGLLGIQRSFRLEIDFASEVPLRDRLLGEDLTRLYMLYLFHKFGFHECPSAVLEKAFGGVRVTVRAHHLATPEITEFPNTVILYLPKDSIAEWGPDAQEVFNQWFVRRATRAGLLPENRSLPIREFLPRWLEVVEPLRVREVRRRAEYETPHLLESLPFVSQGRGGDEALDEITERLQKHGVILEWGIPGFFIRGSLSEEKARVAEAFVREIFLARLKERTDALPGSVSGEPIRILLKWDAEQKWSDGDTPLYRVKLGYDGNRKSEVRFDPAQLFRFFMDQDEIAQNARALADWLGGEVHFRLIERVLDSSKVDSAVSRNLSRAFYELEEVSSARLDAVASRSEAIFSLSTRVSKWAQTVTSK